MAGHYFISDVHLGLEDVQAERNKQRRLLAFLDRVAEDGAGLFILGDLFDAWLEYRTVIPKGFHRILARLHDIADSGIPVHYLAGNHDFWMRDYFSAEMGITVHRDEFAMEVGGKRIFFHHGDGLAANDSGYRLLKKVLRNPAAIWLYSWVHPDIGIPLARGTSKSSRRHTSGKIYEDGMEELAGKKIAEGFDIVVMGHRHAPLRKEMGRGVYVNLGDWISYNTYGQLDGGVIDLKAWPADATSGRTR